MEIEIRKYSPLDEEDWLICHNAAYSDSYFFDEQLKIKPRYENPSIELIGLYKNKIQGILDIEIELEPGQLCFFDFEKSALISILGIIPLYRRKGIATKLLNAGINILIENHTIHRLEICARNDIRILSFLEKNGFTEIYNYYQVTLTSDFFFKFGIDLPFELNPIFLTANIDTESFSELIMNHSPEKTEKMIILEKKIGS